MARLRQERGWTLVEMMVVLLVIAVLILIMIPAIEGARKRSQDRAAQAELKSAFVSERVYYADHETYTTDTDEMEKIEPAQRYTNGASTDSHEISLNDGGDADGRTVILGSRSKTGRCYYLKDVANAGTSFGSREIPTCDPDAPGVVWGERW